MPPEKNDVTITLVVDTASLLTYPLSKHEDGPYPKIDKYCHFEQEGGDFDRDDGQNESFKTSVKLSEVKSITWVGKGSTRVIDGKEVNICGTVSIQAIESENHVNVFSSLNPSRNPNINGHPKIMVGTLENEIQSPTKHDKETDKPTDNETYTIRFSVNFPLLDDNNPSYIYSIDPKLEINT